MKRVICALLTFDESDVRNYTWTVFRYTGSVTTGDASLDAESLKGNKYR